jgi:hypothetical protein
MVNIKGVNFDDEIWSLIDNSRDYFKNELLKEMNKNHLLYGVNVKEIARREDRDDVLFELLDGTGRYAVVHLTWIQKQEKDARYPRTRIYQSINEVVVNENY